MQESEIKESGERRGHTGSVIIASVYKKKKNAGKLSGEKDKYKKKRKGRALRCKGEKEVDGKYWGEWLEK